MSARLRYTALVIQGVVIWFAAAMCIRFAIPAGWLDGGAATAVFFALSLPGSMLGIELIHRINRGEPGQMIRTSAVIALSFGGAWLLWIVGAILAYALARDRR